MLLKKTHTTQVSKLSELNPYQAEIALCWIAVVISEAPIYYCRVLLNTAVKKVIWYYKFTMWGKKKKVKLILTDLKFFFLWYYIPDMLFESEH